MNFMNVKKISLILVLSCFYIISFAQVNQVQFGKNRVQYNKFKWEFYQTENFNVFYYKNGKELAKQVAQMAELELPKIENTTEYRLQRRANIVLFNTYDEYKQTNIGLSTDWVTSGGTTKLVNNKCVIYFSTDHADLKKQVRIGVAKILTENILFGDNLGEIATNQALLDLPAWLIEGYYSYIGEPWNTTLDDELKNELLLKGYKNYYRFAYKKPDLAGKAFWHYIDMKYKKENTTYFLYLSRVYKSLNTASLKIAGLKFKPLLKQILNELIENYDEDVSNRKSFIKGDNTVYEKIGPRKDLMRFAPNPIKGSDYYGVVVFKKGKYYVNLVDDYGKTKTLLKYGTITREGDIHPTMPLLSWDNKGEMLSCIYWKQGGIYLFVYDNVKGYKVETQILKEFDQIQSINYMPYPNQLLLSAVKNGQSDIYTYNIESKESEQITNDVFADLDASFVTFPNKSGIIFSSNRPAGNAPNIDTILPANYPYNVFMVDNYNKTEYRQISQLTNMKYGQARMPTQYNINHFTFVSDENGVANRWAGLFKTESAGLDTVAIIGNVTLRNPSNKEMDSVLISQGKNSPDSLFVYAVSNDSAYAFPITDYETNIRESKVAGDNDQVSEVNVEGNMKSLYKMKIDANTLRRRNVNPRNTKYRNYLIDLDKKQGFTGELKSSNDAPAPVTNDIFQSEFDKDTIQTQLGNVLTGTGNNERDIIGQSRNYPYRLKFSVDKLATNLLSNEVIFNNLQPYGGGAGPINLANNNGFNGLLKASVYDMMEDYRITGAMRLPIAGGNNIGGFNPVGNNGDIVFVNGGSGLLNGDNEIILKGEYLKKRFDFTATYYRSKKQGSLGEIIPANLLVNIYGGSVSYPFDETKSLRFHAALRAEDIIVKPGSADLSLWTPSLQARDARRKYALFKFEYVYDNVVEKAQNILNGLRYKAFVDINSQVGTQRDFDGNKLAIDGRSLFNAGFDARYYHPIYRNVIWATRVSGDFSWGDQKMIYYLGGVDGWMTPRWNNNNPPDPSINYAFQTLAVNLRGSNQNIANGNNNLVINSEVRAPILPTIIDRPINNAFLRNFQVVAFLDLGTAWNGSSFSIKRPTRVYTSNTDPIEVNIKQGGIGPFIGGYGYGVRSQLLGYFVRLDLGYDMNAFFKKPILHFALGVDF
jgi:hypothetical protein